MIDLPHYLLPPSALNIFRRIPVDNVVSGTLLAKAVPTTEEALLPVTLGGDLATEGWRVRWERGVLGEIGADIRAEYSDIERVLASGYAPETIAGISFNDEGAVEVDIFLPAPELTVPRNNLSANVFVLPPGELFMVDTAVGDFGAYDLQLASPGQWLVVLLEIDGEPLAVLDGRVLGGFNSEQRDKALEYIRTVRDENNGAPVAARGYIIESAVALDMGAPQGDAEHVLPLRVPDSRPREVRSVEDQSDGTFLVSVAWFAAIDEDDIVESRTSEVSINPEISMGSAMMELREEARTTEAPAEPVEPEPEEPEPVVPVEPAEPEPTRPMTQVEMLRARRAERARRAREDMPLHASDEYLGR